MQAVILAAGMGKRLGKYTEDRTKCMVEVGGKHLIDRAVEAIKGAGIRRLVIVVGYKGRELEQYLKENIKDLELIIVHNDVYDQTNNIYSLYLAKNELAREDTILLESDLIYDYDVIRMLVDDEAENMVTVAKYEQWMDGTVAKLDKDGNICEFIDKVNFRFSEAGNYYKTVNIYKFSKDFLCNQYIPFLDAYIQAYGKNQYYEMVLKILAHVRYSKLKALILKDINWYEIDNEQDLKIAEVIFAEDDRQFEAYDHQFGGFWRFPKLKDFCYLVNPYYPPQKMTDHMKFFFETLLREYPSGLATQNLNMGRMFGISSDNVIAGNGAAELIYGLGKLLKGKMLVQMPVFNEYVRCFSNCEIDKLYSLDYDFNIPIHVIEQRLEDIDIAAIINPDNPSGSYISKEDMLHLITVCEQKGKMCIVDESFIDFAEEPIRYTLLEQEILDRFPNLVVIKSISKSYGVPGLRLGVLATSNQELLTALKKDMSIWNINSFAEYFLQIQDLYDKAYLGACNQIAYQRALMEEELKEIELLKVYPSQANYIMCMLKGKMTAKELANILVKKYNIMIKDLSTKDGVEGMKFIRVAVKSEDENRELIKAVKEVIY